MSKGYTTGRYAGQPHFQCSNCPWSTLTKDLIEEHVAAHKGHAPTAQPADTPADPATTTARRGRGGKS